MKDDKDIREFIGKAVYHSYGQMIFREPETDNLKQFLDVRGWGSIQHMFDTVEEAEDFQDRVGQWVTNVINKELQKE